MLYKRIRFHQYFKKTCSILTICLPVTFICFQFNGRTYPCEHCDKIFSDPSNLQRHIRAQHHGARSHTCDACGKTFATSSGLKQHQHIHSSVKPFQCEVCLKAYTQFSNLCRHKRMHADCRQQIKCKDCGQSFSTMTSLSKHKRFCEGMLRNGSRFGFPSMSPVTQQNHGVAAAAAAAASAPPSSLNSEKVLPSGVGAVGGSTSGMLSRDAVMAHAQYLNAAYLNMYAAQAQAQRPAFPFYQSAALSQARFPMIHPSHPALNAVHHSLLAPDSKFFSRSLMSKVPTSPGEERHPDLPVPRHVDVHDIKPLDGKSDCTDLSSEEVLSTTSELDVSVCSDVEPDVPKKLNIDEKLEIRTSSPIPIKSENIDEIDSRRSPSVPRREKSVDLSKNSSTSPSSVSSSTHELPLDLSNKSKEQISSDDGNTPRKNHIFGHHSEDEKHHMIEDIIPRQRSDEANEPQKDITPEKKPSLHFPYALPSPVIMDPIYRVNKEKYHSMQEAAARSMAYGHRYQMSQSHFSPMAAAANQMNYYQHHHQSHQMSRHHHQSHHAKSLSMLKQHEPYHYSSVTQKMKERYCCKFCGKIFPRSANLTRHLRTHTGEQPYKCKYCERSFSISSNLQRHVRNIHNKEKPYKCPLCDRSFGQQTNLDRHLKKHETEGPVIVDSPPSTPLSGTQQELGEKEESYFDEIRNFIDKTSTGPISPMSNSYEHHQMLSTRYAINEHLQRERSLKRHHEDIDVEEEDDEFDEDDDSIGHQEKSPRLNHNNNHVTDRVNEMAAASSDYRSDSELDIGEDEEIVDIDDQYSMSNSSINSLTAGTPLACS